ncbi:efflux RND transporter periplasmic adaptor subunit [Massilia sp. DWR3-1-1]|uniref:efflux RND transporter periplasmic adaptor subunit n=1 Tax=Massilia sp. DWR3-1-1 TaxID=2804559 RepID=UPI003CF09C63
MSSNDTISTPVPASPAAPGTGAGAPVSDVDTLLGESAPRPWWRRWTTWLAVAAVLAVLAGAYAWQRQRAAAAAPSYTSVAATRGDLTLTVTANGTIQPTRSINIGSELSGTVLKVNVDVNDLVKKGQVLVVLDTAKLRDQILRSQAGLAAANGKLAQTGATLAEARSALARFEDVARLSGGQVPARTELDGARATLARAVADHASAQAGVADARAALSTDQISLSKASIVAPTDGVVLTRTVDPGNTVAASLQAVTLLTIAEDIRRLRLWVYVDEADVGAVKMGQDATFTVAAYLARNYPARITRVGLGSTITDSVVTYLTYLDVDNADLSLRPGMTATATITATRRQAVLLVPNAALRFAPAAASSAPAKKGLAAGLIPSMPGNRTRRGASGAGTASARQVWVLAADGSGAPRAVAVTPGISDGHMTEITGGELVAGMRVITDQKSGAAK